MSKADIIVIRSESDSASEIDKLLAAQILQYVRDKYKKSPILVILRPGENIEVLSEEACRGVYERLKAKIG